MIGLIKNNIVPIGLVVVLSIVGITWNSGVFAPKITMDHNGEKLSVEHNKEVVIEKDKAIADLLAKGKYKCCMKEPCFRCFSKPGNQDKDLVCDCLEDIMNGKHPCGECIGEILEGEGNSLVAEYFATAIAEKVGEQHLDTLKQIISEQYDMPVEVQI